jgi:hypothetical protein
MDGEDVAKIMDAQTSSAGATFGLQAASAEKGVKPH